MISAFILYYLNIKPTHGYEIQKFLQVSGAEQWAKIQSGSIYYALTKLEKDKYIQVLREERTGSRVRKIYAITENGKEELHRAMAEELDKPISTIGSLKFFTDPMLSTLNKDEIIRIVKSHIAKLEEQKNYWEKWFRIKVNEGTMDISRISFNMTIDNIGSQISWHQELLKDIDEYIKLSKGTELIIKSFDFDQMEEDKSVSEDELKLQYAMKLKNEILQDPQNALANLDKIIEELQGQIEK
jgi:DNA-binding PadR family transcriptional regulator